MALSIDSDFFFLDEPFSSLDESYTLKLKNYIKEQVQTLSKTFILIDHEEVLEGAELIYLKMIDQKTEIFTHE